ncbi:MAG TPA: TRAP transporter small permease [Vineibacter sp.]|nr:TRAP transporter small permease [Vineibacter sp.]
MTGAPPATDPFGRLLDRIDALSLAGAWASAACVCSILVLIVAEVAARNLLNLSLDFAWEFSAFFMGAAFLLGAGYTLRAGAQIRVNVLLENVPRPLARALDIVATICGIAICAYLAFGLSQMAWLSWERNSRTDKASELPLWIPQAAMALGALLLTLQILARLGRLARREPAEDSRLRQGQDIE